jgi:phosphoadenosine phosphosulfate reductase
MAGVRFDAHFNFTTVDPPEVVKFIRTEYPDVSIDRPRKTMWELIENKRMPPTRIVRYCCGELKERGGEGRFVITGVRSAESAKRKNRKMVDLCYTKHERIINPIIDWEEKDVWEFIKSNNFKYPCLYRAG